MKLDKAVVPVAGLGTRLRPTTIAVPKEMLPLGRLPVIHRVVDELTAAGIDRFLMITGQGKEAIESHLRSSFPAGSSPAFAFTTQAIPAGGTKPLGTGDAIARAESYADGDPFLVAFGDSLIRSPRAPSLVERMIDCHRRHEAACTIAVYRVAAELTRRYGIVVPAVSGLETGDCAIEDILEKPGPDGTSSRWAVSARYTFSGHIFEQLRRLSPAADGEIYLTDAIRGLIREGLPVRAVFMQDQERRVDIGNHRSYYEAFLEYALEDGEWGAEVAEAMRARLLTAPDHDLQWGSRD